MRCSSCRLLFRAPTDPPRLHQRFYNRDYSEGYTTDCPSREALDALVKNRFIGSERDYSSKIDVVLALGVNPGARVLDYGASWGYGTWQLRDRGYDTVGYEIGRPRARYARAALAVPVHDSFDEINGLFDLVFCSHVLEHTSAPMDLVLCALSKLRPGGLFLAFTPNGCSQRTDQEANRHEYRHIWGLVHPILLDAEFYRFALARWPTLLCSSPYDTNQIRAWNRTSNAAFELGGDELAVTVVKEGSPFAWSRKEEFA